MSNETETKESIRKEKPKLTSYPKDRVWVETENGWVTIAATPSVKKSRAQFCRERDWICTQGC